MKISSIPPPESKPFVMAFRFHGKKCGVVCCSCVERSYQIFGDGLLFFMRSAVLFIYPDVLCSRCGKICGGPGNAEAKKILVKEIGE